MTDPVLDDNTVTPPVLPEDVTVMPSPRFLGGSAPGTITRREWMWAFVRQMPLWFAGALWTGTIDAAMYLKENWTIMQGYVPWWVMVIAMGVVGTLLAINGILKATKHVEAVRAADTRPQ